jgi:hypothetical protein
MDTIFVNGTHLVCLGITGNAGDEHAVASITVPVAVPDLVTVFQLTPDDVANALGIAGLRCTGRPLTQLDHGGFEVRFEFEGFHASTPDAEEEGATYSFDTDMAEEPIESHPKFAKLKELYGPLVDGKFPETYAAKGDSSSPYSQTDGATAPNPLAGVESWLKAGGVFSRSYAVRVVPSRIYNGIGTLVSYPRGAAKLNIPHFRQRKWLKLPPLVEYGSKGAGTAARVTERYRLTGATTGSEAILYAAGQLDD